MWTCNIILWTPGSVLCTCNIILWTPGSVLCTCNIILWTPGSVLCTCNIILWTPGSVLCTCNIIQWTPGSVLCTCNIILWTPGSVLCTCNIILWTPGSVLWTCIIILGSVLWFKGMDTHSYRLLQGHHSNQVSVSRSYCFRCTNWNAGLLQVLLVSHLYIPMPGCFYSWFALLCTCHDQQNIKICTGNFSPYYSTHKALSH
jgi:hypothetical protein